MTGDKIRMDRLARLFAKDFVFFIHWLKQVRKRANGLGFAQEQEPSRFNGVVKRRHYLPLQILFEINKQVAAGDQIHLREGRITQKILPGEDNHLPQELGDAIIAILLDEEPA